jgi:hypothetical protein
MPCSYRASHWPHRAPCFSCVVDGGASIQIPPTLSLPFDEKSGGTTVQREGLDMLSTNRATLRQCRSTAAFAGSCLCTRVRVLIAEVRVPFSGARCPFLYVHRDASACCVSSLCRFRARCLTTPTLLPSFRCFPSSSSQLQDAQDACTDGECTDGTSI